MKWHFNMLLILHWCWDLFAALKICYFWYHKLIGELYLCTGDSRLWKKLSGSTNELRCWKYKRICTTNLIETILYRNFVADKMAEQDKLISFVAILKKSWGEVSASFIAIGFKRFPFSPASCTNNLEGYKSGHFNNRC